MPVFFSSAENGGQSPVGRVVACRDSTVPGTTSFIKTEPVLSFETERSIITRVTVSNQCNFQALHTIGNDIYIYSFGDRIGQMTISGLSLARNCAQMDDVEHGFEKLFKWWRANRLANRKTPIVVTIGQTPIEGLLVSQVADVVDPSTRIMQFGLTLMTLPEK
jgi:hypothetical protein